MIRKVLHTISYLFIFIYFFYSATTSSTPDATSNQITVKKSPPTLNYISPVGNEFQNIHIYKSRLKNTKKRNISTTYTHVYYLK